MKARKKPSASSILVVEDEDSMAQGLIFNLQQEGYRVTLAKDGTQAIDVYRRGLFDLVILDVMLPYYDGFEVARRIKAATPQLPILFLTAVAGQESKIQGLKLGADDYLTKPFHLEELLLRVRGMLKRKQWYARDELYEGTLSFGTNSVDFETLSARNGERSFVLTSHEARLLKYLWRRETRIVSRGELLQAVWNEEGAIDTRTVDNFIMRLRKYFERNPSKPIYFLSVRGAGYRFMPNSAEPAAGA
jgi:two-component system, OmpR family, alkaline phosphatase synthesis response regulator PhoP